MPKALAAAAVKVEYANPVPVLHRPRRSGLGNRKVTLAVCVATIQIGRASCRERV